MGNNLKKRRGLQMGFAVLFAMLCVFAFRMDAKAAAPVTGVRQIAANENYVKVQWNQTNDNLSHRLEYSTDNAHWYIWNKGNHGYLIFSAAREELLCESQYT